MANPVNSDYSVPYLPLDAVQWAHSLPRGPDTSNEFPASLDMNTPDTKAYIDGIMYLAAIFATLGALLFLLSVTLSLVACRRCCCFRKKRRRKATCGRKTGLFLLFVSLLAIGGLGYASIAPMQKVADNLEEVSGAMGRLSDGFRAWTAAARQLADASNVLSQGGSGLKAAFEAANYTRDAIDEAQSILDAADGAASAASAAASAVRGLIKPLGTGVKGLNGFSDRQDSIVTAEAMVVGSAAVIFLITIFVPFRACGSIHVVTSTLLVLVLLLLWIAVGAASGASAVVGDFCVDPYATTSSLLTSVVGNGSATQTGIFYLYCDPSDTGNTPLGFRAEMLTGLGQLQELPPAIDSLQESVPANRTERAAVDALEPAAAAAIFAASSLANTTVCSSITPALRDVVKIACGPMLQEGWIPLLAIHLAAALLLFVALMLNLAICVQHPSDRAADIAPEGNKHVAKD